MQNVAEDAADDFFRCVQHNDNHVLHPLLPERNDRGYADAMIELSRQTMTSTTSYTDSCINIKLATNFSTSPLSIV